MLNQSAQSIESKNLVLSQLDASNNSNHISSYLNKIKALEVEQIKSYLGIAYFVFVSLLAMTLFL